MWERSSSRDDDAIVAALRQLGGIAHLDDINPIFGQYTGRSMDQNDRARVRQLLQTHSSDASWQRPGTARDLFYSMDGVTRRTGLWGLRDYLPQRPDIYPFPDLPRAYDSLVPRSATALINVRGIAYRNGRVLGVQVRFGSGAPYPDRLMPDGSIEHIGEGKGLVQEPTGGNAGMLASHERGEPIPVFQYVIDNRYATLGDYKVERWRRESLQLDRQAPTDAYVFTLQPMKTVAAEGLAGASDAMQLAIEAGSSDVLLSEEGQSALRTHLARERNAGNREAVVRVKGARCEVCSFDFSVKYGPDLNGFIEVHHLRPIAGGAYVPTLDDFAVLCANCHRAAHKGRALNPRTPTELRALIQINARN
jgi:predicted HNH restriction endonuclease